MVILIIGLLMGLLLPAISAAVESGRKTLCLNHMKELASGVQQFETSQGHFPGWLTPVRDTTSQQTIRPLSWTSVLLPYIGRNDLYDRFKNNDNTAGSVNMSDHLVCPSDGAKLSSTASYTSYVANTGRQDNRAAATSTRPADWRSNAMFLDLAGGGGGPAYFQTASYVLKGDGLATTFLLSENLDAWLWAADANNAEATHGFIFWPPTANGQPPNPGYAINGPFNGQRPPTLNSLPPYATARPSSNHPGGVNAVFADGSSKFVRQDMPYWVYCALMTPNGRQANEPGSTNPSSNMIRNPPQKLTPELY